MSIVCGEIVARLCQSWLTATRSRRPLWLRLDDYGHWDGCRRTTDEFLSGRAINVELTKVDYTGPYFHKPAAPEAGHAGLGDSCRLLVKQEFDVVVRGSPGTSQS